ncbi:MAG: alpha/beta hydrolase [Alphaproteobacteria bacterium]|nr:MAG: alpha/beta hydrolase [Alphaproteobacteria bacterium]
MPEMFIAGPEGRIEARYFPQPRPNAPVALILHPHPQNGGNMNTKITFALYKSFVELGFNVLRFNFRGVGRSEGLFDGGEGELTDAATLMDWLQAKNPDAPATWVAGFSFGSWIGMQLLMRRPEIAGFVSVSPPANTYDFSFLAPCPVSGMVVHGTRDAVVPASSIAGLLNKLALQKNITVTHKSVEGADHFYDGHTGVLMDSIKDYVLNQHNQEAAALLRAKAS